MSTTLHITMSSLNDRRNTSHRALAVDRHMQSVPGDSRSDRRMSANHGDRVSVDSVTSNSERHQTKAHRPAARPAGWPIGRMTGSRAIPRLSTARGDNDRTSFGHKTCYRPAIYLDLHTPPPALPRRTIDDRRQYFCRALCPTHHQNHRFSPSTRGFVLYISRRPAVIDATKRRHIN